MGRRIFISYQHEDIQQVRGFILLKWNKYVDFEFVGRYILRKIRSKDENYIKRQINEMLNGTSTTVVLIGKKTAQSEWVDYEIRRSLNRGNAVLAIRLKDVGDVDIPPALEEEGCKVIDWNPDVFEDEIERACLIAGRPSLEPPLTRSAQPSECIRQS